MGALSYDLIYMSKPINHTYARIKPTLLCDLPLPHDSDTLKQKHCKLYAGAVFNYHSIA